MHGEHCCGPLEDPEATVVHLRAADLIPEREKCARSEDDQDTRYCRECMKKPCRWFSGWRPEEASVPDDVARELETACNNVPTGKTQDHFKARRTLFHAVDSQIRARVKAVLPDVTLEFKQQIERDLGLDALRRRVHTVADSVDKEAQRIEGQLDALIVKRLDELFTRLERDTAGQIMGKFVERQQSIVAEEVGRQIGRLLAPKIGRARVDREEYTVRVQPKKKARKPRIKRAP